MIAVDTNLLVRVLTNDDPAQASRAARILESEEVLIPKTVELIENDMNLPTVSDIASLAEYRFEKLPHQTERLVELLRQYDQLLSGN